MVRSTFVNSAMFQSKNILQRFSCLSAKSSQSKVFKYYCRNFSSISKNCHQIPSNFDVVIIGAGAIGTSIAYWIKRNTNAAQILVIDKDLTYKTASTVLSAGGLRQQFSLKENVLLSLFGANFIQNFNDYSPSADEQTDFGFKEFGYLMLCSKDGCPVLRENHENQRKWGVQNELLTPSDLQRKFPWLNVDGIALGCLGLKCEGWFDPWLYLTTLVTETKKLGAYFIEGYPIEVSWCEKNQLKNCATRKVQNIFFKNSRGETHKINCSHCILAAGAQTGNVAKELLNLDERQSGLLQFGIPIEPRKRFVYCYENPDIQLNAQMPMVIDPSRVYVRREGCGDRYICGCSPGSVEEEPNPNDLEVDYEYFTEKIWPQLSFRIPCFEKLRLKSAWAGYYEYNKFDQNGIVGYHPAYSNVIIASGFSGHGLQHSPGVGRAVSELLADGCYKTIDLKALSFDRIVKNEPLLEREII